METNNLTESAIPKRRALGRGLEELFNSEVLDYNTVEETIVNETPKDSIIMVKLVPLQNLYLMILPKRLKQCMGIYGMKVMQK